jgi:hypothetical protein
MELPIFDNWLGILAAVVAVYLFATPLLVLFTFKSEAHPTIEAVDPEALPLPTAVAEHLDSVELSLQGVGFEPRGVFYLPQQMANTRVIGSLLVNRTTSESAAAITIYAGSNDRWQVMQYVEFTTRYRDGRVINTGNPNQVSAFKPRPNVLTTYIPWLDDPQELYEAHRAITAVKGGGSPKELRVDTQFGGDGRAYIAWTMGDELEAAAKDGYLRLNGSGSHYVATIKGAYLMTWKQLQPFKFLLARARDRRARRILAEAGFA